MIKLKESGRGDGTFTLEINGVDLSDKVELVSFHIMKGHPPDLTLRMNPEIEDVEIELARNKIYLSRYCERCGKEIMEE